MSTEVLTPLPVHAVDVSSRHVAALTGANILVWDRVSGEQVVSLAAQIDPSPSEDAGRLTQAHFPRLCAFSPSGQYLAIASDDKVLRVWQTERVEYGAEVLLQRLAKRAGTLQWTCCASGEEVVVADKFGDVWSFVVDPSQPVVPLAAAVADADTDNAPQSGASLHPRLGHVSMLTCLTFLPSNTSTPKSIVTCDRDEHIRISRWGEERAAHIVEEYLLGSRSCVGAMTVVPAERADKVGFPAHGAPVLLTSDGGSCVRAWCRADSGRYALHATVHLASGPLLEHVCVDAGVERRREKVAGNVAHTGPFDPSAPEPAAKRAKRGDDEAPLASTGTSLVLQQMWHYVADETDYVLLRLEGADALMVVPLASLVADASDIACSLIVVGAPILSCALLTAPSLELWLTCDDRPGMGSGAAVRKWVYDGQVGALFSPQWTDAQLALPGPLASLTASGDAETPALSENDLPAPAAGAGLAVVPHTPRALAPTATISKLCLYSQLLTWPKPPQANADGTPFPSFFLAQHSEPVARDMVERFQSGKRAAGRAKNQATIQQQFAADQGL